MPKIAAFTIASKNYLAYARVLLNSVAEHHPEFKLFLCLVDEVDGYFDPTAEAYHVIPAAEIGIPSFLDMTLRYDIMELNTAVKPFMLRWLLRSQQFDAAIYFDPDIRVYAPLTHLESTLSDRASVVLTPHIIKPLEDGKKPNDYNMLQVGVFNLGFIAATRCDEALNFIDWWARRLATQAVADLSANLFTPSSTPTEPSSCFC
jgi:hypothetical protein